MNGTINDFSFTVLHTTCTRFYSGFDALQIFSVAKSLWPNKNKIFGGEIHT